VEPGNMTQDPPASGWEPPDASRVLSRQGDLFKPQTALTVQTVQGPRRCEFDSSKRWVFVDGGRATQFLARLDDAVVHVYFWRGLGAA
jgi:hypothetical protein